jgi:hypothetical protein
MAGLRRDHDILEEASLDKSIVTPVGMADWMSSFHADSIPDLNYFGLSSLVSVEELEADCSVGESWATSTRPCTRYSALAGW